MFASDTVRSEPFFPKYPPPTSPFRETSPNRFFSPNTPIKPQPKTDDACFRCNEKGHWARDCPSKTPSPNAPSSENSFPKYPQQQQQQQQYPELQCKCGQPCLLLTSRSEKNPGREFYRCKKPAGENCKFFQWCDEVGQVQPRGANSPVNQAQPQHPICMCTAGPCRVETYNVEGYLKGCKYYACYLKRGHCSHFEWCCTPMDISESNGNDASNELELTHNLKYEEPINNGTKDLHSFQPPTPPTSISEHELIVQGSSPVKRPNSFEESPSKRTRVEEWLNDCVESLTFNCYVSDNQKNPETSNEAIEASAGPIVPESPPRLEKRAGDDMNLISSIRRLILTEKCCICGEEGHGVSECLSECISEMSTEAIEASVGPSAPSDNMSLASPIRRLDLTEKCCICGEEGHGVSECIGECISYEMW